MSTTTLVLNGDVGMDSKNNVFRILPVPFGDTILRIHVYDRRDDREFFHKELKELCNAIVECKDPVKLKMLKASKDALKPVEAFRFWYWDRRDKNLIARGKITEAEIGASDRLCYGRQTEDLNLVKGKIETKIKDENVIARTRLTYAGLDEKGYVTFTCDTGA